MAVPPKPDIRHRWHRHCDRPFRAVWRAFNLPASEFTPEILARTQPTLADLGVAVAAGAISSFAKIRPKISDALAGTALAVAYPTGSWGALSLLTNLLGMTQTRTLVFIWGGYYLEGSKLGPALGWASKSIRSGPSRETGTNSPLKST